MSAFNISADDDLLNTALHQDQIRLLQLEPSKWSSSRIEIKIIITSISSAPPYEALSYAWGDNAQDRTVYYLIKPGTERELPATDNLCSALEDLRYTDKPRILWVDAICINQKDIREKSEQVRILTDIYSEASNVVVWLGHETPNDEHAFRLLRLFNTQFQIRGFFSFSRSDYSVGGSGGAFPVSTSDDWVALVYFFQRPWWLRVWSLQEIVMAQSATFCVGRRFRENWELIGKVAESLQTLGSIGWYNTVFQAPGVYTAKLINRWKDDEHIPLLTLLSGTRLQQANDPRDKVFALMGLASDSIDPDGDGAFINYEKDVVEVYKSLAKHYLCPGNSLEYLSHAGVSPTYPPGKLPSWVANWEFSNGNRRIIGAQSRSGFKAAGETTPDFQLSASGDVLIITGHKFSKIDDLGFVTYAVDSTPRSTSFRDHCHREVDKLNLRRRDLKYLDKLSALKFKLPEGQTREEAVWRNFHCNMDCYLNRMSGDCAAAYESYHVNAGEIIDASGKKTWLSPLETAEYIKSSLKDSNSIPVGAGPLNIGRTICITRTGHIGNVPSQSKIGNIICILEGGVVPFVLEKLDNGCYKLVGECYIHGIMDGEAMENKDIKLKRKQFSIV